MFDEQSSILEQDIFKCKDNPEKQKIVNDYLNSLGRMSDQLTSERERQLNNWKQKFEKKLTVLCSKQEELKQRYSLKLESYLTKHQALWELQSQILDGDATEGDIYDILRQAFVGIPKGSKADVGPIELEDIELTEEPTKSAS